ncbi:MAG: HIT domain-containing protein [Terriglobales bacterium]
MDYIFSPWRYRYVSGRPPDAACALCAKLEQSDDAANLIVYRARHNAILLNLFPYTTGHLMILPFQHAARLRDISAEARAEMIALAAQAEQALETEYQPDGLNLGLNLGAAAGAGIAGHLHFHVLPRWVADANFMTVVAETRVLPEDLARTYQRLRPYFPT